MSKVLIVDDQSDVREALRLLLKSGGYIAVMADSPDAAIAAVLSSDHDLIVIDMNFGSGTNSGEEGLNLLDRLRSIKPDVPVIAMTGWSTVDLAVQAMKRGATDFITKPWDADQLLRIFAKHIDGSKRGAKLNLVGQKNVTAGSHTAETTPQESGFEAAANKTGAGANEWSDLKEIFSAALALAPEKRSYFLDRINPLLRDEVVSLLDSYESGGEVFEQPLMTSSARLLGKALDASFAGEQIGGYRIVAEIGHGGMGAVYRAIRDGDDGQAYALKIIRPGLNQDLLIHRFRQEMRILKELQHPHIASVLDSGTTAYGQPFFVMDLIEGDPVDEYCDGHMLSVRERLVLFVKVCEAVQAAHVKAIVHRDLKPSNVLVTAEGSPRLLDFGIAKVLNPDLASQTIETTATIHRLMTPEYASPEQARGEAATTASDVYSLGVILYELLTGQPPYSVTRNTPEAMLQAICEQRPLKPSSRFARATTAKGQTRTAALESISARRSLTPKLLSRRLKGSLDNIVLKALEKDPARRYQTAQELASDVFAYLERRPITAHGESLIARIRGLREQRRIWLLPAIPLLLALIAGSLWRAGVPKRMNKPSQASMSIPVRSDARPASRRSVAVLGFRDLRESSNTAWLSTAFAEMLSTELAAGEGLRTIPGEDVARTKTDLRLSNLESFRPATLQRIKERLGSDLVVSGSYLASGDAAKGPIRLDVAVQDANSGETVTTFSEQGEGGQLLDLVSRTGADLRLRLGAGGTSAQEMNSIRAFVSTKPQVEQLYWQGLEKLRRYEYQEARKLLQRAVAFDPAYPLTHVALAEAWSDLGYDQLAQKQARAAYDSSKQMSREGRLWVEGQYRMTTHEYEKAVQVYQTLWAATPDNLNPGLRLVAAENAAGKPNQALSVAGKLRALPPPMSEDPRIDLAEAEAADAAAQYQRAYELSQKAAGKAKSMGARLLLSRATLLQARMLAQLGRYPEALATTQEARRLSAAVDDRRGAAIATRVLGRMYLDKTQLQEASDAFDAAEKLFAGIGDEAGVALVIFDQSSTNLVAGNPEESVTLARKALAKANEIGDVRLCARILNGLGVVLRTGGDLKASGDSLEKCIQLARSTGNQNALVFGLGSLGELKYDEGDLAGAQQALEDAIKLGEALARPGRPLTRNFTWRGCSRFETGPKRRGKRLKSRGRSGRHAVIHP